MEYVIIKPFLDVAQIYSTIFFKFCLYESENKFVIFHILLFFKQSDRLEH